MREEGTSRGSSRWSAARSSSAWSPSGPWGACERTQDRASNELRSPGSARARSRNRRANDAVSGLRDCSLAALVVGLRGRMGRGGRRLGRLVLPQQGAISLGRRGVFRLLPGLRREQDRKAPAQGREANEPPHGGLPCDKIWPGNSSGSRSGPLRLLQYLTFFHHEQHALGGRDVGRRIAGHGDDVGELARLERPDLVGDAEQFGIERGGRLEAPRGRGMPSPVMRANSLALTPWGETAESVPKPIFTPSRTAVRNMVERAAIAALALAAISGGNLSARLLAHSPASRVGTR